MVFQGSLSDSKSPQVSRTLLSILPVLNNAVVWMISTRPSTSKSSSPFSNPLVTVPNAPITIGITVTWMYHVFFYFPSQVEVLIHLFIYFQFYSVVSRDSKFNLLLLLLLSLFEFFTSALADSLLVSNNKSPHVSRTFLSILAVLNNAVVWMVFTRLPTSKSSSPFNNPLVTAPIAPITIGIIVTWMFHSFFNSLARSRY